MNFGRAIWADMVEKRLWPVAALLVLGLIAVPVALPKLSGETEPTPPLPVAAPIAAAEGPAAAAEGPAPVTVVDDLSVRKPTGRYDDPFTGGPGPKTPAAPAAAAAGGSSAAPVSASAPAPGAASPGSSSTPTPTPTPATPAPDARPATGTTPLPGVAAGWRVDVAWGHPGGVVARRDLPRLKILRTNLRHNPAVIYLGVAEDHRAAYFVPTPGVVTWGDGRCLPSRADCEVVLLRKGRTQMFDVPSGDGVTHYQLDLDRIVARRASTAHAASEARSDISESGRDLLARIVSAGSDYLGSLVYSARRGVVRRLSTSRASAAGTTLEPVVEPAAPTDPVPPAQ